MNYMLALAYVLQLISQAVIGPRGLGHIVSNILRVLDWTNVG